jgi:ribose/xylose/arabinose/galactoside ABC-type transport system permease subunit
MTLKARAAVAAGIAVSTSLLYLVARVAWGPGNRISLPTIIFAAFFAVGGYLLKYTRFGHYVYAIGGNEQAAWLAGVNTRLLKAATYAICGFTCAAASLILVSMGSNCAAASDHNGLELEIIASVIVGGTPLGGGSGGLGFTLTGVMLLQIIDNLLTQFSVGTEYRKIVSGLIILVVVAIDVLVRKRGRR